MPHEHDLFDPFGESPDPRRYVPLATSERILADLAAQIRDGRSPILLAGPGGVGKTLLLHVLGDRERRRGQRIVYSPFFHLPPDECARWLLHLLGARGSGNASPEAALFAALRSPRRAPTLLLVDEIQAAPEASVRKLAEIAQAGRPALAVVAAGSDGWQLRKRLSALAPEATLRFPVSLPDDEIDALCAATLARPELPAEFREALSPERDQIVGVASGIPRVLKAELEVRTQNLTMLRGRRRPVEELCLDTWTPPVRVAPAASAPESALTSALASTSPSALAPTSTSAPVWASAPAPASAEAAREHVAERPRRAARRRVARETSAAWAARAVREARRAGERWTDSIAGARHTALERAEVALARAEAARAEGTIALARGACAVRARGEAALALGARVAQGIRGAAHSALRGVASALGQTAAALPIARRVALPASGLCALLFLVSDHGAGPQEVLPTYTTAAARIEAFHPTEEAPLPGSTAEPAIAVALHVQAQINARPWAHIRIDGIDVGPTPLSRPLAPGVYRIEAEFPDGRSVERRVAIGPERRFVALP